MVEVLVPLAVIVAEDAVIVEVVALAAPGTKATVSLSVMDVPPTVPVITELPAVVAEVSVAVYVPSPLSVTEDSVPSVLLSVTVAPPVVRSLSEASFNCMIIVVIDVPSAVIEVREAVMVEFAALDTPLFTKATVSSSPIDVPANVPVITELPAAVAEVRVAAYVPLPLSITEESVPSVTLRVTVAPPVVRLLPLTSFN